LRESTVALKDAPAAPPCPEHEARFRASLAEDLNVPSALAAVWDCVKSGAAPGERLALLRLAEEVLALGLFEAEAAAELDASERELLQERANARKNKDFGLADRLRKELSARGILVEDGKDGQKWRRK
ncbi:MAG: cysteinyl-tRNA synthetase, partial [Elusimicrobia bacterium]